ncbi:EAL domain-containing protein [Saccharopolyspora phatthalungensis]|uniref:Diguanylate cyclase (GGDEF)-like protein/PAS domain S-box-containing protein n=1 Tax=Saccharopolyspora phatthalungensis TaxID=664693 RepID=A0A840QEJ8_9PSEU|nr:EAL domain-containing protein [Saccharopolyspora phatthalungensis]MBB5158447.1 diguanylate cyclase (GGDEF)-like protein/PAS domain S-box-containing protein [Saccharopolyspora phatthalungensis]
MDYPQQSVHTAYQPLVNIGLGGILAVQLLPRWFGDGPRPSDSGVQPDPVKEDLQLVVGAIRAAADCRIRLPLHLSVRAHTVVHDPGALMDVRRALWSAGRQESETTLEIRPPLSRLDPERLLARMEELRGCGFRVALVGVGMDSVSPSLVTDLRPDLVKLTPSVLHGFPDKQGGLAVLESMRQLADVAGAALVVDGADQRRQFAAVRRLGARLVQGALLAPVSETPPMTTQVSVPAPEAPGRPDREDARAATGPPVVEFLAPATMLPADALADEARKTFTERPEISGIVLVDDEQRPLEALDRNRFLLAMSGPYGHALHAGKPASRLADKPRIVTTSTTAAETMRLVTTSDPARAYEDAVVVDEVGRCLGVIRANDLVRGVTDDHVEDAAALNPPTRLAPLKRFAKTLRGPSWVLSRPNTKGVEIPCGHNENSTDREIRSRTGGRPDATSAATEPDVALTWLRRSSQRFTDLLAVAPVGIGLFDQSERLVDANDALCRLLGYRLEQLRGCTTDDLSHPQDQGRSLRPGMGALGRNGAKPKVLQRLLMRSDGQPVSCELHTGLSVQDDGTQFWLVVFQDITERHRQAEALHHRATHDDLTGLPNRAAVKDLLASYLAGPVRDRTAVLFCDIDKFKRINDSLGHDAGDELLVALARILENGVPPECTVVRLSGDEFVIVCSNIDAVGGLDALATRVSSLLHTTTPVRGQLVRVSASIGAAVADRPNTTADDLLRFADAAVFEAKRRGPGKVSLASPTLIASADGQLHMEGQLRDALSHDELELHYQPVVASDGLITGFEALVRWPHPDLGLLSPAAFLPIAEQGDLLRKLDRWVLRTALREAAQWPGSFGCQVRIGVNLAGLVPGDPRFVAAVSEALDATGIAPDRVVLELVPCFAHGGGWGWKSVPL